MLLCQSHKTPPLPVQLLDCSGDRHEGGPLILCICGIFHIF